MENTARLYNCARCHSHVTICSYCDRGNIYCSGHCTNVARNESLRAAGKRYQNTYRGRLKHAERQRCYRSRYKKVTHQGSPEPPSNDPLTTRSDTPAAVAIIENEGIRCHFCGRLCSAFLRLEYLHTTAPSLVSDRNTVHLPSQLWAQAP
ncbi:MAG: hypothetical protein GY934_17860 [Gammaproteobacteria bacterium]|nr:hypothetical protein [Gammaproteobacteria bacterium]